MATRVETGFARPDAGGLAFADTSPREMALNLLWSVPETRLYYIKRRMGGPETPRLSAL